ncbi:MAG: T9SS type A sorting domain-containing protein [Bacteroidota bacterium]
MYNTTLNKLSKPIAHCANGLFKKISKMRNLLCLMSCVFCLLSNIKSQNLVPNPSFEIDSACSGIGFGKIYYSIPWFQPSIYSGNTTNSSSSDLFSVCGWRVPVNNQGFQYARTGSTYAAIYCYYPANIREYIEVPLFTSLIANHNYCVDYYISLANKNGTAISNMGAYFSIDSLLVPAYHAIDSVIPQVENPAINMLNDTLNWMLVSGSFTALGGEKFMTIGNFELQVNVNTQVINGGASSPNTSYYYVDDVSVIDCTGVGVQEANKVSDFKLYPNPNNGDMTLEYKIENYQCGMLNIYDLPGKLIKSNNFCGINSSLKIEVNNLNNGVYYYEVKVGDKRVKTDKIVIIK